MTDPEARHRKVVNRPVIFGSDLTAGDRFDFDSHRVTETEILEFAQVWDPQYFHTDVAAAAAGHFGGIIASGIHTVGIFQRLAVRGHFASWSIIAGRGIRDLRFLHPVRPDDVLTGGFVIDSVRPGSGAADVVEITGSLVNQRDRTVLSMVMEIQMRRTA